MEPKTSINKSQRELVTRLCLINRATYLIRIMWAKIQQAWQTLAPIKSTNNNPLALLLLYRRILSIEMKGLLKYNRMQRCLVTVKHPHPNRAILSIWLPKDFSVKKCQTRAPSLKTTNPIWHYNLK